MAKGQAELTIKILGKVDKSLNGAIKSAQGSVSSLSSGLSKIGTMGLAAMTALGTAGVAAIVSCTKEAEKYETAMADVVKYVDGIADDTGKISNKIANTATGATFADNYGVMKDALLDLSTQIPMTAEDLASLAAAAGQSGKGISDLVQYDSHGNITGFLKDAAMMATAMDISADQAGDWAAKWEKAFNINHDQVMEVADQINYLGANTATTAAEIANAVNSAASLGQVAGVDISTTAALADAMLATGVSSDKVGTSLARVYTNMTKGESATKRQKEMWAELGYSAEQIASDMQADANETLKTVFRSINEMPKERQVAALSTLFGQWAIEGTSKIVGNLETFTDALTMVSDPKLYEGSMAREFAIKADTSENLDLLMSNAFKRAKIDFGEAFLPVKKQFATTMLDIMQGVHDNMPQLVELGNTLADLASKGVDKLGNVIRDALPYIQKGMDYVANNGEKVAKTIGLLAAAFVGMKAAPAIESVGRMFLGGGAGGMIGGGLIGGAGMAAVGKQKGGFFRNLFTGGQKAASGAVTGIGNAFMSATTGMNIANSSMTPGQGTGLLSNISNSIIGAHFGLQNMKGLTSANNATMWQSVLNTSNQIAAAQPGGLGGLIRGGLANTKMGQYAGSVWNAGANVASTGLGSIRNAGAAFSNTRVGGAIVGGIQNAGSFVGGGLSKIGGGIMSAGQAGLSAVGGRVAAVGSGIANSGFGQAVGSMAGKAGGVLSAVGGKVGGALSGAAGIGKGILGAGGSMLGSIASFGTTAMGPVLSMFGSLVAGAAPVIAAISSVIAIVSILGDHLDGIRGIVGNVFGDQGLAVFDAFIDKLSGIKDFISGLFVDGGVEAALAPLKEKVVGFFDSMFGSEAGQMASQTFGSVVTILQSVMGVVGQIVDFATTTVKPIIEEVFSYLTTTVLPILLQMFNDAAPTIGSIISNLGTAVMSVMTIIGQAIRAVLPVIESIVTAFLKIASVVIPAVLSGINVFAGSINTLIEDIKGVFNGLMTFISGVFTGNWSQAWEGIKQIFGNAFNALVDLCKTPFNAVIAIINGVVSKINGLNLTIPEWVPIYGGKNFSLNIPALPQLAKGGFTNGVSIAGEAGQEAVISFMPGVRGKNIDTWMKAGQMLGVDGRQAAQAAGISDTRYFAGGGFTGREVDLERPWGSGINSSFAGRGGEGTYNITLSPNITIQGNADQSTVSSITESLRDMLDDWYESKMRMQARTAF